MKVVILGSLSDETKIRKVSDTLLKKYNCTIIYKPSKLNLPLIQIISICFNMIEEADLIIAIPKDDINISFGDGVTYEIAYARRLNKRILLSSII